MSVKEAIDQILNDFENELNSANDPASLESVRVKFLGKKSPLTDLMKTLKDLSKEERPLFGQKINDLKKEIQKKISLASDKILAEHEALSFKSEKIDITLPGRKNSLGKKHPIDQMMDRILSIFTEMGFSIEYGPDIETDTYNFEALNFLEDHPARDMQDTFYITPHILLRTHTSNVQARVMESATPPIRVVAPGKVYRNEDISSRSHVFFHQVDGFYIDENVSFADLLTTLNTFFNKLFNKKVKMRTRTSYFPFVEPGLEADVECVLCSGNGCKVCKESGWLEVIGAGMIHPNVLKAGGIDPEKYSGYAWGLGVDRLVMQLYGIEDIRMLTQNDLRMLNQF